MKVISLLVLLLTLTACGSYSTVTQTEETTFIAFTGDTDGLSMIIDEGTAVDLEQAESFNLNGKRVTRFGVSPGLHELMIKRGDTVEIHQKIYVSEGNSVEVRLQ